MRVRRVVGGLHVTLNHRGGHTQGGKIGREIAIGLLFELLHGSLHLGGVDEGGPAGGIRRPRCGGSSLKRNESPLHVRVEEILRHKILNAVDSNGIVRIASGCWISLSIDAVGVASGFIFNKKNFVDRHRRIAAHAKLALLRLEEIGAFAVRMTFEQPDRMSIPTEILQSQSLSYFPHF